MAGPGEVLVQVGGAGACHSDLHLMHDFEPGTLPWDPPFTLGHENAGWVHALGAGRPRPGARPAGRRRRRLGLRPLRPLPGRAGDLLRATRPSAPVPGGGGGLGLDGGMAEYLLVPAARHLVPLPDGLDPVVAAPLTDAGPDAVPRGTPVARQARPRQHRGGHRRRRARPPGRADPAGDRPPRASSPWTPSASRPAAGQDLRRRPGARPRATACVERGPRGDRRARRRRGARLRRARTRPWPPAAASIAAARRPHHRRHRAAGTLPVSFFGAALRGERADDLLGQPARAGRGARPGRPRAAHRRDHDLPARGGARGVRRAGRGGHHRAGGRRAVSRVHALDA